MSNRVLDPSIPYIAAVERGDFYPGKVIRIRGFVPNSAYRFNINLQCGPETTQPSDIALQVAVHLFEGYISLNSLEDEVWGEEHLRALLFQRGKQFEIILKCDVNQYKLAVDDQYYCEFPQRIHYNRITYLAIDGDVSIFQISYEPVSTNIMQGTSGHGSGEVLRPSAITVSVENDSSAPPSYEAALNASKSAPYPTCDPMGMPCPTGAIGNKDFLPYPLTEPRGMPSLPSRKIGIVPLPSSRIERDSLPSNRNGMQPYSSSFSPRVIPPPARDAPVPLNMGSSHTRPVGILNTSQSLIKRLANGSNDFVIGSL